MEGDWLVTRGEITERTCVVTVNGTRVTAALGTRCIPADGMQIDSDAERRCAAGDEAQSKGSNVWKRQNEHAAYYFR